MGLKTKQNKQTNKQTKNGNKLREKTNLLNMIAECEITQYNAI